MRLVILVALCACAGLAGCATVKVEPIHITVDINIKVDRALDDFFAKPAPAPVAAPAPASASATAAPAK